LISLGLPPFGLLYAAKFYFSGKADGKQAAYVNIALTFISVILLFVLVKGMLSGTGTSVQQIEQIQPQDYQQFLQ
jgi:Na+-driven multidrug efflux pump